MRIIRFTAPCAPYIAGDVASLPADLARKMVTGGVAVEHEQATAPVAEVAAVTIEHPAVPQETAAGRRRRR